MLPIATSDVAYNLIFLQLKQEFSRDPSFAEVQQLPTRTSKFTKKSGPLPKPHFSRLRFSREATLKIKEDK